jgi:hypothetical protein
MFMDRKNIGTLLQNMTDRRQLLDLLNTMKREQFGAKTFPITLEQLKYYGNVDNENRYHTFLIKRKQVEQERFPLLLKDCSKSNCILMKYSRPYIRLLQLPMDLPIVDLSLREQLFMLAIITC